MGWIQAKFYNCRMEVYSFPLPLQPTDFHKFLFLRNDRRGRQWKEELVETAHLVWIHPFYYLGLLVLPYLTECQSSAIVNPKFWDAEP